MRILIISPCFNLSAKAQASMNILCIKEIAEQDLETIKKLSPDLIYLSVRFPGHLTQPGCLQGPQILKKLKERLPNVPVVGVSSVWNKLEKEFAKDGLADVISASKLQILFPHLSWTDHLS